MARKEIEQLRVAVGVIEEGSTYVERHSTMMSPEQWEAYLFGLEVRNVGFFRLTDTAIVIVRKKEKKD